MSLDTTPHHSWKMAKRYFRSVEAQDNVKFIGIWYIFEYVDNQSLDDVLFACISHDSLLISQFRDIPSTKKSLRFSEFDNNMTIDLFDPETSRYVVVFDGAVSASRRAIEQALSLLVS